MALVVVGKGNPAVTYMVTFTVAIVAYWK